jgi:N-acyl-D-aspartate/D-glutamate deacylase
LVVLIRRSRIGPEESLALSEVGLKDHPRGLGTHARVLARYVRDQKTITLSDAIRKMSFESVQGSASDNFFISDPDGLRVQVSAFDWRALRGIICQGHVAV